MSRRFIAVALGAIAAVGCADAGNTPLTAPAAARTAFTDGQRLVVFTGDAIPADFESTVIALGGTVTDRVDPLGVAGVTGVDDAGLGTIAARADVRVVGPNPGWSIAPMADVPATVEETFAESAPESDLASASTPNTAAAFARQWNLRAIGAPAAWAAGRRGSPNVTVAVVDGGIDYLYRDLVGRVDLARSVSFVPEDDQLVAQRFPTRHPVTDLYFHGTAVASIISSNASVLAGVTSGVTLMGVKVIGVSGNTHVSTVIKGIVYAADHGADVINVSLGDAYPRDSVRGATSAINRAMNYAHRKGAVVVVAAGNDAIDMDHNGVQYVEPCNASNVICVGATGPIAATTVNGPFTAVDTPAPYSNFGRSALDVVAPGGGVAGFSMITVPCSTTSLVLPSCQKVTATLRVYGTSLAAPHVSGLAALLVETLGRNPSAIKDAIVAASDDLGEGGTDPFYGKGRINVARALGLP